jgi:hypothetical protein
MAEKNKADYFAHAHSTLILELNIKLATFSMPHVALWCVVQHPSNNSKQCQGINKFAQKKTRREAGF